MKIIVYLHACFLLCSAPVLAQTGSKKSDVLLDSARHYIYMDNVKSFSFILQLDSLAKKENNQVARAYVHHLKGIIDEQNGDNTSALFNYISGIKIAERAQNISAKLRIKIALSTYYLNRSHFQKCIEICQEGISEALALSDYETASMFYNNLSMCHTYMKEYDKALEYSDKSIELKQKTNNSEGLANAYLNKGLILTHKGDYETGFKYYAMSADIYSKNSNHVALTQTYINYGWDLTDLKQFQKARDYLNKALFHANKSNDRIRQAGAWNALGYYYKNIGHTDSVAYALEQGLHLSIESENKRNALIAYQELSDHYHNTGNPELAFLNLNKASKLKDSIFNESKIQLAQSLNARYETKQKEEQIALLHATNKNQKLLLSIIFLTIFLIVLLVSVLFQRYKKQQKVKKENELQNQKEMERMRIARDMHDEIGAGLTRIIMRSEQAKLQLQSSDEHKNCIEESLNKMVIESRVLSHNIGEIIWALNPKNDTLDNLFAYIRSYAYDYLEETDINCNIDFPNTIPETSVSPELRRNIFLIVKEALNNMVKHSNCTNMELKLWFSGTAFSLSIKDNGTGLTGRSLQMGNGLENMKKRTEEMGGNFTIKSDNGHCLLIGDIPLKKSN